MSGFNVTFRDQFLFSFEYVKHPENVCGNQARVRLRLLSPGSNINLLIVENTLDVKQISCPNIRGDCRIKLVLLVNVSFVNTKTKDLWLITQRLIPLH